MATRFKRSSILLGLILAMVLLLSTFGATTDAQGKASPGASGNTIDQDKAEKVSSSSDTVSSKEAKQANKYWTKERMKNAKPLPKNPSATARAFEGPTGPEGPAKKTDISIPNGLEKAPIVESQATTSTAPTSTAASPAATNYYSYPFPYSRTAVPSSYYKSYPYSTMGRVFFQVWTGSSWRNSSCSGTVIGGQNRSTIWTAGHCVRNAGQGGRQGALHRNWVFAPAYQNGIAPFGTWAAKYVNTPSGWANNGQWGYDLGAVVVYPNSSGTKIANRVGNLGITWNQPVRQNWRAVGYPADPPFNGMYNFMCTAPTAVLTDYNAMGIGCDMTGGASGGGWTIGLSSSGGWVNSVNSHKYTATQPQAMYGPYQGTAAANLFNAMQGL